MVILVIISHVKSSFSIANNQLIFFSRISSTKINGQNLTRLACTLNTFQTFHSLPYNVPKIEAQNGLSSEPIPQIDQLYSPKFPLEIVREFVMGAIQEAVEINQVHNRDPIGGSNENLFL